MSEANTVDPVQAAIAAAQQAAAAAAAQQAQALPGGGANLPATTQAGGAVARPGKPLSMDDMSTGGISVDAWIGVKEYGLVFDGKLVSDPVRVEIDLSAVAPCYAIKFGNPATYYKTYDRVSEARGGSWDAAVAKAQSASPTAREYRSVDVPMRLLQDVMATDPKSKAKTAVAKEGSLVGHSTSTTNWGLWDAFYRECVQAGLQGQVVQVELSHEGRSNKAGNNWGVIRFGLIRQ